MTRIFTRSEVSKSLELNEAKAKAKVAINERMDQIRSQFITDIAGQGLIYMAKEAESLAYLNAEVEPYTQAGWEQDYPFIAGEVGSTGDTAYEVAQVFLNLAAQWRYVGAQLEKLRIETIHAVGLAKSQADIDAALSQFEVALGSFAG